MHNPHDPVSNASPNPIFAEILKVDMQRRRVLQGGLAAAAATFLPWTLPSRQGHAARPPMITFAPVPVSTNDAVHVPEGYVARVLYAWGDPVSDGPAFRPDAANSAAEQALQAGMHHDGMHYFPLPDEAGTHNRGLLVINHEYVDDGLLHRDGMRTWSAEKVRKSQAAHGVSVIEVRQGADDQWQVVRPSHYGRRITANTPMRISGPAAGHAWLRTRDDPQGNRVLGTLNNCANGFTPWGTYLACEENFPYYFAHRGETSAAQRRYGLGTKGFGYRWEEFDERFDAQRHPNEPNRFGWVVEIDPFDPDHVPVKRTALGRFSHEGAAHTLARDGRVVIYSGDDQRNEYIYKFVSRDRYDPAHPSAARDLLDHGTLYVARFTAGGAGEWLELSHGRNGLTTENGFASQAEVLIHARLAADRAGATMMDRPEWIAINPVGGEAYCALSNNSRRGALPPSVNARDGSTRLASAHPPIDAANPRADNVFGHILRWREAQGDAASTDFQWDIFIHCGDPSHPDPVKRGDIRGDTFGSPDGLWIDRDGRLWIQTDASPAVLNKGNYASLGNNQMLCADTATGEVRRFLTGPRGCEITGAVGTPDGRTLFVNIQHPGETAGARSNPDHPSVNSAWPDGGRPRSATLAIRRVDGGSIGT
ncbi:MAG: PhoX family phosphatase [Burkholderiales bacterium]|nr:PhoX family phosphatase [Burkholderiales bacterium]